MKKLILILATLALFSQSFADCIHTVFEYEQATIAGYDKSFDGLLFDSMYVDKGTANTRGNSIYILKYYRTGDKVDSAYEANLRNGEWQYKTTINPDSVVFDIDHVENNWTIIGSANGVSDTISIYFDGDSLAITSTDEAGKYTNIYVMGNDTLFRYFESEIIVNDERDTNTCYVKDSRDNYVTTWYRYDTEVKSRAWSTCRRRASAPRPPPQGSSGSQLQKCKTLRPPRSPRPRKIHCRIFEVSSQHLNIYQKVINGYFKKVKGRRCRRSLFFVRYTKLCGNAKPTC